MLAKDFLEIEKRKEELWKSKKYDFEQLIKAYYNDYHDSLLDTNEAFKKEKLYLPLSKLRKFKGKNITSIKVLCINGRNCYTDVTVNDNNELEAENFGYISNQGFLGFYDVEIDGKMIEETTREFLIEKSVK